MSERQLTHGILREKKQDGSTRYKVRISWMEAGKQREACKRFRKFEDARAWKSSQENKRNHGGIIRPATKLTLNEYLDGWLAGLNTVSARTRVDYERVALRYWRPALGHVRLDHITREMIREVLAGMTARGLSPRTVQQARAILRIVLGVAVEDGILAANPSVGKRMIPAQVQREQQVLSAAHVNTLLDGTRDDPHGALWAVLLTTGVRVGEALGLRWGDIDLDRSELRVRRVLVRPTHGRDWLLEEPKTEKSRRAVPLIAVTVAALAKHRDRQKVERVIAGERYGAHDFVFATPTGEPLEGTALYKYHWLATLKRLALPRVRLYDCRHSAATMWLEAGLPMKVVQELLGHASMTLTADTYSHVLDAFRRQAGSAMAAHLKRAR